jgi:uncharacterized NAD-dependent epimerase/dehydratase family protein
MRRRALVLAEGVYGSTDGKTAHGLVRRSDRFEVLGVIDSGFRGMDAGEVLDGRRRGIRIYGSLEEALRDHPDAEVLIIGAAVAGGRLPPGYREVVAEALRRGMDVVSGLHEFLSDDPELARLAAEHGAEIVDVRKIYSGWREFYRGEIDSVDSLRVVVVGTDSAIGKRTTALMLADELSARGVRVAFIGTGQTAWMQGARYGIVLDAMVNDFITGGLEREIVRAYREERPDVIVVPGQGALLHPAFPGSLEILTVVRPEVVVLQHAPARRHLDGFPQYPMPDLDRYVRLLELITGRRLYAITVNTEGMTPGEADAAVEEYERRYGVVSCAPLLHGVGRIVDRMMEDFQRLRAVARARGRGALWEQGCPMVSPDLTCFEELRVEGLRVERRGISADYVLRRPGGPEERYRLLHRYEGDLPPEARDVAPLMVSVPAVNYALFSRRIVFDVPLTELDAEFLSEMSRVTARDIFVNRIVNRTGFVRDEFIPDPSRVEPEDAEPRAEMEFPSLRDSEPWGPPGRGCGVMSSGGKESLLTYGVAREIGCDPRPCFLNESGHHWFTALRAYRWFRANEPRTIRVWSNVDRLYSWVERNMRIIRAEALRRRRPEVYPIRLFFFEHYVLSCLPALIAGGAGDVLLGNEYDDPSGLTYEFRGIRHYYAVYDQSQEFDAYMTRWFRRRGWGIRQWSAVRPLSGLVVERVLASRYPELFRLQVSCHSAHPEGGDVRPCGTCFKCNGIQLFLLANGLDPRAIGYREEHVRGLPRRISRGMVRLDADELEHSVALASRRTGMDFPGVAAREHPHVEMLQFDDRNSRFDAIPPEHRERIWSIYEGYARGYAYLSGGEWAEITREEALRRAAEGDLWARAPGTG